MKLKLFMLMFFILHGVHAEDKIHEIRIESYQPKSRLGVSDCFFNLKQNFHPIKVPASNDSFGFLVKYGTYVAIRQNLPSDLFLDYYLQKVHFQSTSIEQVGGFRVGGSLGYRF